MPWRLGSITRPRSRPGPSLRGRFARADLLLGRGDGESERSACHELPGLSPGLPPRLRGVVGDLAAPALSKQSFQNNLLLHVDAPADPHVVVAGHHHDPTRITLVG